MSARAENGGRGAMMTRGWQLLEHAAASLSEIRVSTASVARLMADDARNFIDEGAVPFIFNLDTQGLVIPAGTQMAAGRNPVLAANKRRRGMIVVNAGAAGGPNVYLGLGQWSPSVGSGLLLPPGASWDGRLGHLFWRGSVSAVAAAAGGILTGVEA